MRIALIFIFILGWFVLNGQSRLFNLDVLKFIQPIDSLQPITKDFSVSSEEFDPVHSSQDNLVDLTLAYFASNSRGKKIVYQSEVLQQLSELATKYWRNREYHDLKKWKKTCIHIKRGINRSKTEFNIVKEFSFRIKLVSNHGKKFHYDSKKGKNAINLFYGRSGQRKVKNEDGEWEEVEKEPLPLLTEIEIFGAIERELKRKGILRAVKKGWFNYFGVSVIIDKKNLFKNRLPTARVIILCGGKRLQLVG